MLEKLLTNLSTTLYVQLWENRIKVVDIKTGNFFDEKPLLAIETTDKGKTVVAVGNKASMLASNNIEVINPFSHPRALLSDFTIAEKILQHIFKILHQNKLLAASPLVVIHPIEKIEGGLTMIEHRALTELAMGAGARSVVVYQGPELSIHNFDFEQLKASQGEPLGGESTSSPIWLNLVIFLAVIGLFISPIKELLQIITSYFN
jgi:rod shape-determining protein MreB